MPTKVRTPAGQGNAKRFRNRSAESERLSPTLADEIGAALELLRGTKKAEGAAWEMGWSQSTWYERVHDPLTLTVAEFLRLIVLTPDPKFNARLRGHLAALDAYQAVAEREAGQTYLRVHSAAGQRRLPLGGER